MKFKRIKVSSTTIDQISKSSILTAIAILAGMTGFIKTGVSVYLTAAPLFLSTLLLKFRWSALTTIISVVIVDEMTSWIAFTWISLIGYLSGLLITWLFTGKNKTIFMIGVTLACLTIIMIYTLLWWYVKQDHGMALVMLGGTSVQMLFIWIIVFILYKPILLSKNVNLF